MRQEPDLRRVVSAKQVRAPPSPVEIYSGPSGYSTRAASQVHLPSASQDTGQHFRASVQPIPRYGGDRSPSPALRHVQRSPPPRQGSVVMPPPARRIVVDQYGNRFVEAPVPVERQASIIPLGRPSDLEPRYEPVRATSVRMPSYEYPAEPRYVQRATSPVSPRYVHRAGSPASPRYVEYTPSTRTRSMIPEQGRYHEGFAPPNDAFRVVSYPGSQTGRFEDMPRPRETVRMASVRPMNSHYEFPREPVSRVQSARPEQERIVDLGARREMKPQSVRQVSVRPEEMYMRPAEPVEDRPRYQYAPHDGRQYSIDGAYEDRLVFEAPREPMRRIVQ